MKLISLIFLAHPKENSKIRLHSSIVPSGATRQLTKSSSVWCDELLASEIIFLPEPITEILTLSNSFNDCNVNKITSNLENEIKLAILKKSAILEKEGLKKTVKRIRKEEYTEERFNVFDK